MIDFGVLGTPFATPLADFIGPSRRREWLILSALLVRPNREISTHSLVDVLWDAEPPSTARQQVQNCIGFIRRAIEHAGSSGVRIDRVGDRHTLVLDADRVDHVAFDRLSVAADAAVRIGQIDHGISLYHAALDLWRGRALEGFVAPALAPYAARLEEMRAMTAESYFEFCLAAGRHALVLPELIQYAGDNPLRERAVNHLMIALSRNGQQHEAYAAYQRLALRLDTDLGIQPGLEIRRTLYDILDGLKTTKRPQISPDSSITIGATA